LEKSRKYTIGAFRRGEFQIPLQRGEMGTEVIAERGLLV